MEDRKDQAVIMSTGYAKSLTYQLFQAVYEDKAVIVVSPLISLMEDQVLSLMAYPPRSWGRPRAGPRRF